MDELSRAILEQLAVMLMRDNHRVWMDSREIGVQNRHDSNRTTYVQVVDGDIIAVDRRIPLADPAAFAKMCEVVKEKIGTSWTG